MSRYPDGMSRGHWDYLSGDDDAGEEARERWMAAVEPGDTVWFRDRQWRVVAIEPNEDSDALEDRVAVLANRWGSPSRTARPTLGALWAADGED